MRDLAIIGLSASLIHAALAAARDDVDTVLVVDTTPDAPEILHMLRERFEEPPMPKLDASRWYGKGVIAMMMEEEFKEVPQPSNPPRVRHWQRGGRLPFYVTAPRSRKRR